MYADLVNVIATGPFDEAKIKALIIKLCEGDCQNWDSFYYIFKAMGIKILNPDTRAQIVDKFIDLFGGYLVLGAHFIINVRNDVSIDCFDNIGTLQNEFVARPEQIHWTDLTTFKHRYKWFGYSDHGNQLDKDKLIMSEIATALTKRFPHNPMYTFEQGPIADIQISSTSRKTSISVGGRRRTKRNAKRNATRKRHNNQNKRTSTKKTMIFVKSTKLTKLTRRRK
jgi:hypothetical protein